MSARKQNRLPKRKRASKKGLFLSFEGGEGSGKSTQIQSLVDRLQAMGEKVVVTREPGGTERANLIRELILNDKLAGISHLAELFLYEASRAQLVSELIRPSLAAGKIIVCDRFADSSLVYQGEARGLDKKLVQTLNRIATGGLNPDITFFLDLDPKIGLKRISQRKVIDRLEKERLEFHRKVYNGYKKLARTHKKRFRVIDARQSPDEIAENIFTFVHKWIVAREK